MAAHLRCPSPPRRLLPRSSSLVSLTLKFIKCLHFSPGMGCVCYDVEDALVCALHNLPQVQVGDSYIPCAPTRLCFLLGACWATRGDSVHLLAFPGLLGNGKLAQTGP